MLTSTNAVCFTSGLGLARQLEAAGIEAAETKKAKSDAAAASAAESADIEKLHKLDRNNTKVL